MTAPQEETANDTSRSIRVL